MPHTVSIHHLENSLTTLRTAALLPLALLATAAAHAADAPDLDKAMVGHWISSGKQIVAFEADKSFRMYPKCGGEAAEWKKHGMDYLPATWAIANGNHMLLTLSARGQTKVIDATAEIKGDELRLTDPSGNVEAHKRYTGVWPPVCPATP